MKDIRIEITESIANDTGYDYELIDKCIEELEADGMTFDEAAKEVRGIAEEMDY